MEAIRRAGWLAIETLNLVEELIRPGIKTEEINTVVHEHIVKNGAVPAPLNYRGFPKSVCISVNEEICHGIPGDKLLKDGDIVNVDITPQLNGYYADVNKTFFVGTPGPDARKIVQIARQSLKAGLSMVRPDKRIGDIGWAIQSVAEREGCSVVREFVGHGVGFEFHETPQIPHYGQRNRGLLLVPGMVFTVEPMINLGKRDLHILNDNWTAVNGSGATALSLANDIFDNDGSGMADDAGETATGAQRIILAVEQNPDSASNPVYAALISNDHFMAVFRSPNQGADWSLLGAKKPEVWKAFPAPALPSDLNGDGKFDDDDKVEIDGKLVVPIGIMAGRGQGSPPVLHKDTLFITTTGDGEEGGDGGDFFAQKVNLSQQKVRVEAWREN